jgi:hypothetical protein
MEFVRVNSLQVAPNISLDLLPLNALKPSREQYTSLYLQPEGLLKASTDGVKYFDTQAAENLYSDLLSKVSADELDLIYTPEYCMPWNVIKKIVRGEISVKKHALWALGSESIQPDELEVFKIFCDTQGVKVFCEELEQQNKSYLCPLVYFFWEKEADGRESLCVLIQFKTFSCGGTFEVDNLYLGSNIYIFGNGNNELNLFTLICADVFEFNDAMIQDNHSDSMIFHIQLNQKPWHKNFKKYRDSLFSVGSNSAVQLTCLNWATDVKWIKENNPQDYLSWSNCANSAIYSPNIKVKRFADSDLDELHKGGVYYNRVDAFWDMFLLGNTSQAIIMKQQPIRFDGVQALSIPFRINIVRRLVPDNNNQTWIEENEVDDGFIELLNEMELGQKSNFSKSLSNMYNSSPLAVERSLELLQGPKGSANSWYNRYELSALEVAEGESPKRVTMNYENSEERAGVRPRKMRLQVGYDASILFKLGLDWPSPLKDIEQGFDFGWNKNTPHCNVYPIDSKQNPATLIYFETSIKGDVDNIYTKMVAGIQRSALNSNSDDFVTKMVRAKDRLCVVYKENHETKIHHESDGQKSIAVPANLSVTSFDMDD